MPTEQEEPTPPAASATGPAHLSPPIGGDRRPAQAELAARYGMPLRSLQRSSRIQDIGDPRWGTRIISGELDVAQYLIEQAVLLPADWQDLFLDVLHESRLPMHLAGRVLQRLLDMAVARAVNNDGRYPVATDEIRRAAARVPRLILNEAEAKKEAAHQRHNARRRKAVHTLYTDSAVSNEQYHAALEAEARRPTRQYRRRSSPPICGDES